MQSPSRWTADRRGRSPALTLAVALVLVATHPRAAAAQTPEQRYAEWASPSFPAAEYQARRETLMARVRAMGGGVLLVPSASGITHGDTFRQLDDFWYLTGLELPGSVLALDADTDAELLFLPGRDFRFENPGRRNDFPGRPLGDDPSVAARSGVERTADAGAVEDSLAAWSRAGRTLRVNAGRPGPVAAPEIPLLGELDPLQTMILHLSRAGYEMENGFDAVARTRMVKRPVEVDRLRAAAAATMTGIRTAAKEVRPGVDEATLQGVFESTCRSEGSDRIPFTPIVKSGPNSLWPWRVLAAHYDRRNRVMEAGDLVILDVGCEVDGYISDVGRTFPVNGTFTALQREKLALSTSVSDAIIAAIRPGVTLGDLTRVAYDAIPDAEEPYMQTPSYFGHHIGMSSGDPSLLDAPLEAGMVFTVEPWYYNHDLGVSVFVEDVVLVTADGVEVLTRSLPRSAAELEGLMR